MSYQRYDYDVIANWIEPGERVLEQVGEAAHDREPEPEALGAVAFGVIELDELLEDGLLGFRRDAGAVVADFDAHRYAGVAVVAIRPIGKQPAAAKADMHQLAIHRIVDGVGRNRHLRARLTAGQIAARIRRGGVKVDAENPVMVAVAHCRNNTPRRRPAQARPRAQPPPR